MKLTSELINVKLGKIMVTSSKSDFFKGVFGLYQIEWAIGLSVSVLLTLILSVVATGIVDPSVTTDVNLVSGLPIK